LITTEWGYHTARVNSVAWSPDSRHVASGALDTNAIAWSPGSKTNYTVIKGISCVHDIVTVTVVISSFMFVLSRASLFVYVSGVYVSLFLCF